MYTGEVNMTSSCVEVYDDGASWTSGQSCLCSTSLESVGRGVGAVLSLVSWESTEYTQMEVKPSLMLDSGEFVILTNRRYCDRFGGFGAGLTGVTNTIISLLLT